MFWFGNKILPLLSFVEICQFLYFLVFVNIFLPENLESFLKTFDAYNLNFKFRKNFKKTEDIY